MMIFLDDSLLKYFSNFLSIDVNWWVVVSCVDDVCAICRVPGALDQIQFINQYIIADSEAYLNTKSHD